jgi:hypothetical protein
MAVIRCALVEASASTSIHQLARWRGFQGMGKSLMFVVKGPGRTRLPPCQFERQRLFRKRSAQSRRRGFRRRLIMLLYAGWIPQRPLFARGFPCLPAGVDVHRPRRFPLGLPTVGLTAGSVHIMCESLSMLLLLCSICLATKQLRVVWICSATAMVAFRCHAGGARQGPLPRLRGAEGGGARRGR